MQIVTSWDDGCEMDLYTMHLLKKYKLPGIFYISNKTNTLGLDDIRFLRKQGFEIGGHTVNHPEDMKELTYEEQLQEIVDNKKWLEDTIGEPITSFCYPGGRFNYLTVEAVKTAQFKEARTTNRLNIQYPTDPFRIAPTIHVRPDKYEEPWLTVAMRYFLQAKEQDGYFHVWGHSWEVDKFGVYPELEQLFDFMMQEMPLINTHP